METRAHHVLIGLFTVVAVGGALLFALWLAKSSVDREFAYYDVIFNEEVSGLSPGSPVEYSGIKVGDVTQLKLDPQDPRKVLARIRVYGGTPIKQDTRARLALANITGSSLIRMYGGSPESPLLEGVDGNPPVIVADPSPISKLLANGEDLISSINELVNRASQLFSQENAERVGQTLANLEQTTAVFAAQREDLGQTLRQLGDLGRDTQAALHEFTRLAHSANGLLDEEGRGLLVRAEKSMAALERSTARLELLLQDNEESLNDGLQGLGDIGPAVDELRATLSSLRSVTRRLEENPSGFLFGREKAQEFQP